MATVCAHPDQGSASLTVAAGPQSPGEATLFLLPEHPNLGLLPVYNRCSRLSLSMTSQNCPLPYSPEDREAAGEPISGSGADLEQTV